MKTILDSLYRPVLSVLLLALITIIGAWAANTNMRLDKQDERINSIEKQVASYGTKLDMLYISQQELLTELREHRATERRR